MKLNIKNKFILMNIAIILPMFILIVVLTVILVDQYNLDSVKKTLLNDSYVMQLYLFRYLSENLSNELTEKDIYFLNYELSKMVNLRSQLIYLTGNIQVDSEIEENDLFKEINNNQGINLALKNKKNYILREYEGDRYLLMSFPFYQGSNIAGVIRIIYSLKEEDKQKNRLLKFLLILGSIVFITIIFLHLYFTEQIVSPLLKLKLAVQSFANGKYKDEVKIKSGDEIEELAISFNKMVKDISELIENLKVEKDKQKNFYNNMTHEIRTPLTTILGYADMIKRVDSDEIREECIGYVESEGKRLLRMVNELLRCSKLDFYSFKLKKEDCNLTKLIQETVETIRYKANKYGIKIFLSLENDVIRKLDQDKFKEVILNVIDNAINYSGSEEIDVFLKRDKGRIVIQVKDYGKGISQVQLENIYKRFSGLKLDNVGYADGHGFGLFISKRIIELHGGVFKIISAEGKGTIIHITFDDNLD